MKYNNKLISVMLAIVMLFGFAVCSAAQAGELYLIGDVNFDGGVTAADARQILRYTCSLENFSELQKSVADFDGSGDVAAAAARRALRTSVCLETEYYRDSDGKYYIFNDLNGGYIEVRVGYYYSDGQEISSYDDIPDRSGYLYFTDISFNVLYKPETTVDPLLIKSVTFYAVDYETGDWTEREKWEYSYKNRYPVSKIVSYPGSDNTSETTFEYEFDGDVPVSMTQYDDGVRAYTSEYNNGRLFVYSQCFDDGISTRHRFYSYGNNDGFFTSVLHSSHVADYDVSMPCYNTEEIDTVMVTSVNGLLKKTVNNGLYTNWLDGEDRDWMRFNGTYTVNYDSMGIVTSTSCAYRNDQTPNGLRFEITKEDGRVTAAVRKSYSENNPEETKELKAVFEYTDIPVDPARYSLMINAHLMEEGNNYYVYNWY
ncbi:MAG: dockerin type I repeat-containing protein [Clostridia bacterium]|nr:dockerin type I repeat-containing protein [Clostridia bacterium]